MEVTNETLNIIEEGIVTMSKTIDRENGLYFPGDTISFIINIINNSNSPITGLTFKDLIDSSIIPLIGNTYTVTTTSGNISSQTRKIIINDIDIGPLSKVVITITGRIG